MFSYFDLNKHVSKNIEKQEDLNTGQQILMYFGVFIGVFFSSVVNEFKKGEVINLRVDAPTLIVSAIVALVIIPVAYEKLKLNAKVPFIVRFGLFVQNGVFWQVIFNSLGKIV